LLFRLKRREELQGFVQDLFLNASVGLVSLEPADTEQLLEAAKRYNLDFDDSYQYAAAEKFEAELVSFDSDFDRTDSGRVTPAMLFERFE
jgi:predicted nucleic acid-binding protein